MAAVDPAQPYPSFTKVYHHDVYPTIDPTGPALDCSNRIIFVTGGGRGVGKAIGVAFAKANAKGIVLLGRTSSSLEETAEEIKSVSSGQTATFVVTADITVASQVQAAMEKAVEHFGAVPDVLVNNAGGVLGRGPIVDIDPDGFWKTFEVNVKGPLLVNQAFLKADRAHNSQTVRTVINIPSGIVHLPYASGGVAYACSKTASAKMTEFLHYERPDWNVFNMQPGVVDTELARAAGRQAPDKPEMPAGCAVWLSTSPEAKVFNGRFLWANWDIDEMLAKRDEIEEGDLLRLSLKGWAEDVHSDELVRIASTLHNNARKK
nr:short chain dehydrogenase andi [Quercus suber]